MITHDAGRSDFPFYNGNPIHISVRGWAALMVSVVVAFAVLVLLPSEFFPASLMTKAIFAALPLSVLAIVAGRCWTALFRPVGMREVGMMLLTAIGAMLASGVAALIVNAFANTTANPLAAAVTTMSVDDYIRALVPTAPQLLGEELLTILPFLAVLWLATQRVGISKKAAICMALAASTMLFAAAHLETYHWQVAQCFGVIGSARIVLTLSYIWTRNLWVPVGAHILNDWTEFTFIFGFGHVPIGAQ